MLQKNSTPCNFTDTVDPSHLDQTLTTLQCTVLVKGGAQVSSHVCIGEWLILQVSDLT